MTLAGAQPILPITPRSSGSTHSYLPNKGTDQMPDVTLT